MRHTSTPSPGRPTALPSPMWPTTRNGWLALAAAAVGLGSWIVLPIVTTLFRNTFPVTDTVVMPIVGLVLVVLATIVNVMTLWFGRQRSAMNIVATVLTVAATLFFGVFVIGKGLGGA
jgi:hypothetical protein